MFSAAESLQDALKQLYLIDAIDESGTITSIGQKMAGTYFFLYILVINFQYLGREITHNARLLSSSLC